MSELLDIQIFKNENGTYVLRAKNTRDKLITKEVLNDNDTLSFFLRMAIKHAEKA